MPSASNATSKLVIGCTAAVVSSACQSIGLILQRKAHLMAQNSPYGGSPYKRSLWHVGFLLFIFANVFGSTIQISNLPLIVLSPLQSIGLVFNTVFHSLILHEPFTQASLVGTIFVSVGAFFIAFFGGKVDEPQTSLDTFLGLLTQPGFVVWATLNLMVCVGIFGWSIQTKKSKSLSSHPRSLGIAYGCISGALSAHSLLLAKSAIDILLATFTSHNLGSLNNPLVYEIVAVFLILCLSQLVLLNEGLKYVSTAVLYPLVFCVYNVVTIGNGLIFYQQWALVDASIATSIVVGTGMVIYGVFRLSEGSEDTSAETSLRSPLTANNAAASYYGSIDALSAPPSVIDVNDDMAGSEFTSIKDMAPAPIDVSTSSIDAVHSIPLSSTPKSQTQSSAQTFLRSTTENLNTAGRKVSGFLRKSISGFHEIQSQQAQQQQQQTQQLQQQQQHLVHEHSVQFLNNPDLSPEYVSFGSPRDSQSFVNHHDERDRVDGISDADMSFGSHTSLLLGADSTVTSGLNLLLGKRSRNKGRRPLDSAENQDANYNPNNMFNYSLSNTIDQIQNQLNTLDNKTHQIALGNLSVASITDQQTIGDQESASVDVPRVLRQARSDSEMSREVVVRSPTIKPDTRVPLPRERTGVSLLLLQRDEYFRLSRQNCWEN